MSEPATTQDLKRLLSIILHEVEFLNVDGVAYAICPVPGGYVSLDMNAQQHIAGGETCTREVMSEFYAEWLAERYSHRFGGACSTARAVAWSKSAALGLEPSKRSALPWKH